MDTRPATSSSTNSAATRAAALPPQPDELQTAEEPLPEFLPEEAVSALDPDTADNELPPMLPAMSADAAADAVLEALLAGRDISTELEATAAGLSGTGGGDEGGNGFIRLGRVSETTTPVGFVFPTETTTTTLPEDQRLLLEDNAADISGLAPTIQNGDASVDENDLSGQTPTTTSGSFIISAPDGVDSLVINGVTVISNGVLVNPVVTTPLGNELTITGYNPATGEITYEYELLDNEVHPDDDGVNPLFDEMDVVLTDNDGDSDSDVLSIQVLDDLPDAVDDAASISEDTPSVVIDILANDDEGADGASASVVSLQGAYGNLTQNGDGTWTYHLDTGNPVVQGLGVAGETPETLTDTFTYNLTDTDGDIDTANIVVTITGVDDPVVITNLTPSGQGGDALVDEDDLPDGSDTSKEPLTTSGNFSISAPDGVDDLTIGGQAVITDGVFTATSFVTLLGNTLNITAYDSNTGVVSYTYTLADNETHTNANGQNSLFEDFSVVLTDEDGDSTNNTLSINIVDDVPDAINNTDPDIVSENSTVTTGNVLGNDVQGADGASVTPAVLAGTYGTLTLNADGSYSYALNTSDADFIALNGGGSDTEVFTYTLTDTDGDSDTATLTLNIHNDDDGVFIFNLTPQAEGGDSLVDEDDLPDGSDTTKEPVAVTGDFAISAEDGISTISIGGTLITYAELANSGTVPIVIATALGNTLTINGYTGDAYSGTIYGTYTLIDNETHTSGNGENSRFDALAIIVTDTDGDNTADILSIQIVDDVPQAFNNTDPDIVSENSTVTTGNVLGDDIQGADGASVTPAVIAGTYGTLTLNADGSYSYALNTSDADFIALNGGGSDTEVFTYTLTDADGDSDTATLTLNIHNDDDGVFIFDLTPQAEGGDSLVDEDDLPDGSDTTKEPVAVTGDFAISAEDGISTISIGGTLITYAELANSGTVPIVIATALGNTLTINGYTGDAYSGTIYGTYTLIDNETHTSGNGENSRFDALAIIVTDTDGDNTADILSIQIVDDVPQAFNNTDPDIVSENSTVTTGNVLSDDIQGADGASVTPAVIAGTYGTLTLNADGSYSYDLNTSDADFIALNGGVSDTEVFTYTLTDTDGDADTATLTLTIRNDDDGVTITNLTPSGQGGDALVDEDDLPDGSDTTKEPLTTSGNFSISAPDGVDDLTIGGHAVITDGVFTATSFVTLLGNTLNITAYDSNTGVVSYSYTLADNETHTNANGQNSLFEDFSVVLTDEDGDSTNNTLSINIVDDVPDAINNTDPDIVSENSTVTTGNVLGNDVQGADGASVTPAVIAGTYGTLTLNADGSYSYALNTSDADFIALNGGGSDTEVFTYTLADADGDSDTATLTLNIHNDDDGVFIFNLTPQAEGGDSLVDEDDLPDGSDTTKEPVAVTGDFAISAEDGISTISIGGTLITYAELANSGTVPIVIATALGNTLTINGYTGDAYSGTIYGTYTLIDNETHTSGNGENSRFDALAIIVTDTDGDNTADILSIQIVDDVPQAFSPLSGHVNNADGSSGSFALDIDGNIDNNTGADQTGTVRFATTQEGASSLTSLGETIYFYVSADGQTLTGSTALTEGAVSDGNTIFTVALNQDGDFDLANDSYTVTMSGTIDNGSGVAFTDLSGTGEAGNPSFKIVESGVAGQEILFSPAGGATSVNSDSNDVAVDSQFIDAPEGLRIDFGEFSTANGGDDYLVNANNTINGFSFSVDQISGGTTASILLKAYDADTDENLTNDPLDPITKILVYSALGILLATSDTGNAAGVTFVDHGDGTWTVSGVHADYSVVTLTDDGYSRIEIYNDDTDATDGKFSLSNLEVLVSDTGTPIEQGFDLTLTDTDGDSVDGSLPVTFEPAALATGTTITGTADADTLYGGAGNDTLNGLAGNDLLDGGSGNDTMDGGADNDTLIGNTGNDTMTGGTGADVFVWQLGEGSTTMSPAEDTITDFADGIGGDQLDLRDLLVGEESAPLTDYLHFDLDGSDTVISVSSTGAFDGSNYASATDQRIVLSNVDLVTGSSGDTDIISNLVATSNLRTDV